MKPPKPSREPKPTESSIYSHPEWEVNRQMVKTDSSIVIHDIARPYRVPLHQSNYHRIVYELSDALKATCIGDEDYTGTFEKDTFCLCPANYSASYSLETTDEVVVVMIKPDFLQDIAEQSECLNLDRIELTPILKNRDPLLGQIANSFLREMNTGGLGGRLYSETLATQLAIRLLRDYNVFPLQLKQYSGGLSPSKLQMIVDYIEANFASSVSLNDLARIAQISPSYFLRLFKQSTGITPHQYITQRRVELGKRLLKQKLPIIEIALMCGFASQSSFTKTFRRVVGITPKTYRRQL